MVIVALLGACPPLSNADRQFISTTTAELARLKSEAEQWAHRIKSDYKKGSIQYETAYSKYIPAKASVDKWLDLLSLDLTAHTDIRSSTAYRTALTEASARAEAFIAYVRGLYEKSLGPELLVDLAPVLADLGLKMWDKYAAASKEMVEEIKKSLQALKWKSFDET